MNPSEWHAGGRTFLYKGAFPVFYRDEGAGEALLLLHGFPTASWDWVKLWPDLLPGRRLVALDFLGFGFSAKPRRYPYGIMDQADLVEGLLEFLGLDKCQVLAHDYGDTVAQELMARHLDRVRRGARGLHIGRVALLNGGLFPETHRPRPIQKALAGPFGSLLFPFLNRSTLRKNFHAIFGAATPPSEAEIDGFYALLARNGGRRIFHRLIRYMPERVLHQERWVGALLAWENGLRFVVGGADPISGRHVAERYAELAPVPDICLLEEIGHYPQTEAPERVLAALAGYFE